MGWGEPHGVDRVEPFTEVEPSELKMSDALVADGVSVYACTLPVSGQGHRACLTIGFTGCDGLHIPPIVLLLTPHELREFGPLVTSAVDAAIANARTLS